jgi:polysaccharide transporter, PST family
VAAQDPGGELRGEPSEDPPGTVGAVELFADRLALGGRTLRAHTARGTLINGAYFVGIYTLGLIRGFVVAAFLTSAQYGIWGIVAITAGTLLLLKHAGISDKFVQQAEPDQKLAFQKAFTMELIVMGAFSALMVAVFPIAALVYGTPELIAPGLAFTLALALGSLTAPVWVFYRRMDFWRQRRLQAIDPILAFVVTIALVVAGLGYWSLVLGTLAGSAAGAIAIVRSSPYRLALRFDRATAREYFSFSWPILVAGISTIVIAQGSILAGDWVLGLAGVGAISLAAAIAQYSDAVDAILTQTIYPAICAVRDRTDLLFETFVKSNRLALMWGLPFGLALALFASDLVDFVIGPQWEEAVFLVQAFGVLTAINHVGFNWNAFYRARGETRPIAVVNVVTMLAFLAAAVPLLVSRGLDGFAIGMIVVTVTTLAARTYYLTRLFPAFAMARHALRAVAPTMPAVAVVAGMRSLEAGVDRSLGLALAELAVFLAVTLVATVVLERSLLREVAGYLRGSVGARPGVAT